MAQSYARADRQQIPFTEKYQEPLGKKPWFVDKGYTSLIFEGLLKGKLSRGLQRAGMKFLHGNSEFARHIIENPGGEEALHDIYLFNPSENGYSWLDRKLLSLRACEGTRRRKDEYAEMLRKAVEELNNVDDPKTLELGSGRGSVVLDAIGDHIKHNGMSLVLVDKSQKALDKASEIITSRGLENRVETKRYNVKNILKEEDRGKYHRVGTHGLIDYFIDEDAILLFQNIASVQAPEGILLTTNMIPHNDWIARYLMESFGKWILKYRTPSEFQSLVERSGEYEILETRVVSDTETYTFDAQPADDEVKGFHTIIKARKK